MKELDELAAQVKRAGYEVYWFGPASERSVAELEKLIDVTLPSSFRQFLSEYGGGGVIGAEISGIERNEPHLDTGGTVWGDTKACRQRFSLPDGLVVIYFHDDEVCWCIDGRERAEDEAPVVSYDVFQGAVDRVIASNFHEFIKRHVSLYTAVA